MRIREFFDQDERLKTLDKLGDPLQKLEQWVNWKVLGWGIKRWESKKQSKTKGVGGRPAYDSLVIFKMLILQKLYNLSDDQLEYQCKDRLTFTRFLGLALGDSIPDSKTIWNYREMWIKQGVFNKIFCLFNKYLHKKKIITRSGSIVDASFIDRSKQKINDKEYEQIKNGEVPERIKEKKGGLRQTDLDARMAKKGGKKCNGYKLHIKVDATSKCVVKVATTPANVSDVAMMEPLVDKKDRVLYGDKGYVGKKRRKKIEKKVKKKGGKIDIQIHERGSRGHPLSEEAKQRNRQRSKVRLRVEHVFGTIKHDWNYNVIRSVGLERARGNMELAVLAYNIKRSSLLFERRWKKYGSTVPACG